MSTEAEAFKPLEVLLSAMGGALVTLVAFRTKMALMSRDIQEQKKQLIASKALTHTLVGALERRLDERADATDEKMERLERQNMQMLRMLSDIANKMGVDHRFTDQVIEMMTDGVLPARDPNARTRREDKNETRSDLP